MITVYNSEDMEATKGHINRQMGKEDVVCVYIYIYIYTHIYVHVYVLIYVYIYIHILEYHLTMKMNEILPFAAMWVDWENNMLSETGETKISTV